MSQFSEVLFTDSYLIGLGPSFVPQIAHAMGESTI